MYILYLFIKTVMFINHSIYMYFILNIGEVSTEPAYYNNTVGWFSRNQMVTLSLGNFVFQIVYCVITLLMIIITGIYYVGCLNLIGFAATIHLCLIFYYITYHDGKWVGLISETTDCILLSERVYYYPMVIFLQHIMEITMFGLILYAV